MRKIIIILIMLSSFCFSEDDFMNDSNRFLGSERMNMGLGALTVLCYKTENSISSFLDFPLYFNYSFSHFDRLRIFSNQGIYQSSLNDKAFFAALSDYGLEYAHFLTRDGDNNIAFKLRQNFFRLNAHRQFNSITSLQFLFEQQLFYSADPKIIGDLRIFTIIGVSYMYEKDKGYFSLLAGISLANSLRLSFDFGSLIYRSNFINMIYPSVANGY